MNLISIILIMLLVIGLVLFFVFMVRMQTVCPFCRAQTIDIVQLRGPAQGTILKELGAAHQAFVNPGHILVCEKCRTVFDCRQVKDGRVLDADALTIDDFRCRNCSHVIIENSDFSLTRKERGFLNTKVREIQADPSDRPSYICRYCGCINVWQQHQGSDYYVLTGRTDLGLYPEAESPMRTRRKENAMEEISLINADWSFEPDCISATPPSLIKDAFGMSDFFGEFKILLHERKIICGKKKKRREWPLDGSWQVDTEVYGNLLHGLSAGQGVWGNRPESNASRVRLLSHKHKIAFFLHGGGKFACQQIEAKAKHRLGLAEIPAECPRITSLE